MRLNRWTLIAAGVLAGAAPADPSELPLLPPGQHMGIAFSEQDPVSGPAAAPWHDLVAGARNVSALQGFATWDELMPSVFAFDRAPFDDTLARAASRGWIPYFGIASVNTNYLALPSEFLDPADPAQLTPGLAFDSPILTDAYGAVLDILVPELVAAGGFFISVGNEADIWLAQHPDQLDAFLGFVHAARARIHAIEPDLAVGVTLTSEALDHPSIAGPLIDASDVFAVTYYPQGRHTRAEIRADIDRILDAAGDKQVLLQEAGYASGWPSGSVLGATDEHQAAFYRELGPIIRAESRIRFVSAFHLADWSALVLDYLQDLYGIGDPAFREFLGTLGLVRETGEPKPAYEVFFRWADACGIDFNVNGAIDLDDLTAFADAFLSGDLWLADRNTDGALNLDDIDAFVADFLAGCP